MDLISKATAILLVWITLESSSEASAQSPPRLSPGASKLETLRVARDGETITFNCPIEKQRNAELFFEWLKDGRPSDMLDDRIRIKGSTLKIKGVNVQDDGQYQCNAVNGFGSVSFDFHLVVLSAENEPDYNYNGNETEVSEPLSAAKIIGKFPVTNRPIRKTAGSRIEFKCEGMGNPSPSIIWLHDNKKLSIEDTRDSNPDEEGDEEEDVEEEEEEDEDGERRVTGRWTLAIDPIIEESQGNYTCIVWNSVGSPTSATFNLRVEQQAEDNVQFKSPSNFRAQVIAIEPPNATLVEGSSTTLTCHVQSPSNDPVTIQWFKRLSESERLETPTDKLIQVHLGSGTVNGGSQEEGPDFFRLIKSAQNVRSQVVGGHDLLARGSSEDSFEALKRSTPPMKLLHYSSEIHFNQLTPSSAGEYFCLGTNSMGYTFKSVWLRVIHHRVDQDIDSHMSKSGSTSITSLSTSSTKTSTSRSFGEVSLPLLIAASCITGTLAITMMVFLIQCHRRWRRGNDRCLKTHTHHPHIDPSYHRHHHQHHSLKGTNPNQSLSSGSSNNHRDDEEQEEFGSDEASHLKTPQHHGHNQSYPGHMRRPQSQNPRLSHHPLIAHHQRGPQQQHLLGQGPYPSTAGHNGHIPMNVPVLSGGQAPQSSQMIQGPNHPHQQQQQHQGANGFTPREYHYIQLPSRTPYGYLC